MAQTVEQVPRKCEVLSSNPSNTKRKSRHKVRNGIEDFKTL
jgi:hypothetical protein